jgi:hypothetical protein
MLMFFKVVFMNTNLAKKRGRYLLPQVPPQKKYCVFTNSTEKQYFVKLRQ